MPFTIDDQTSRPPGVVAALREGLPILRGYQDHRRRIDREREENPDDVMLRVDPPRNPYRTAREGLVDEVDARIAGLSVRAWHCTRLCPDEIAAVVAHGMSRLSPETFSARVRRRLDAGDISVTGAGRLCGENQVHEVSRRGQVWFVLTRGLPADPGVADFLNHWGGEALYNSHDRDPETGPALNALGTPCLVEMEIPCGSVTAFHPIGITMVRVFELHRGLEDGNRAESEGFTRRPIPPGGCAASSRPMMTTSQRSRGAVAPRWRADPVALRHGADRAPALHISRLT